MACNGIIREHYAKLGLRRVLGRSTRSCLERNNDGMLNGPPPFDLLEALRWQPGDGFYLLDYHLERLTYSAQYFQFKLDMTGLRAALHEFSEGREQAALKVRVILSRCGAF